MASLVNDPGGRKRICFEGRDGKRKSLRLGKMPEILADDFLQKVEHLAACFDHPEMIGDTIIAWARRLPSKLYRRFVAVGLLPSREEESAAVVTLGTFLEEYFGALQVKPSTETAYSHTRRCLLLHFGRDRDLLSIGSKEADQFHGWLRTHDFAERRPARGSVESNYRKPAAGRVNAPAPRKLSPATISRRILCARHIFNRAKRWGYIELNPFAGIRGGKQLNKARNYFVPRDVIEAAISECADSQWRLIIALSRYGGLRCPSEHLSLRWTDVNLERGTMVVHSPKTEHHAGGDSRVVPIFPELRPYLEAVLLENPDEGAEFVITRYRGAATNLRTQFIRILKRAGLKPWPRLFQNLRASRETELFREFPIETACAWIGNSPTVAVTHYVNDPSKDDHFKRAVAGEVEKAAQIPTRTGGESEGNGGKVLRENGAENAENSGKHEVFAYSGLGDEGPEQQRKSRAPAAISKSGVNSGVNTPPTDDPDLARILAAWPALTPAARAAILLIVTGGQG